MKTLAFITSALIVGFIVASIWVFVIDPTKPAVTTDRHATFNECMRESIKEVLRIRREQRFDPDIAEMERVALSICERHETWNKQHGSAYDSLLEKYK